MDCPLGAQVMTEDETINMYRSTRELGDLLGISYDVFIVTLKTAL
jgi:hypothetical protein